MHTLTHTPHYFQTKTIDRMFRQLRAALGFQTDKDRDMRFLNHARFDTPLEAAVPAALPPNTDPRPWWHRGQSCVFLSEN